MSKHHDIRGRPAGPVERVEAPPNHWQKRMEAMRDCLARRSPAVMQVDEMRRGIEEMPAADYAAFDSYQRKTVAIRNVLVGKGVLDAAEMEAAIRWLRREKEKDIEAARGLPEHRVHGYDDQADDDDHDDHHHDHALSEEPVMDEYDLISEAMIQGLVARGLLLPGELRAGIERAEMAGPTLGADVVVRAWVDRDFKAALLVDGKAAMARIGIGALEAQIVAVENTHDVHNLVVCTLCSCYPRSILGSPPAWHVGKAYRAPAVCEPRKVLAEFGIELGGDFRVRVHDSTVNMRYLVVPMRPAGTDDWAEERLKRLVTRDSMIGVARARDPRGIEALA